MPKKDESVFLKSAKGLSAVISLLIILLCLNSALAENVVYNPVIDTLSVTFSDCVPGGDYSLFIVSGSNSDANFNSGNLLFIDQVTADHNGIIYVAFVDPSFQSCTVYLGGQFASVSSPLKLGVYSLEEKIPDNRISLPDALTAIEDEAFRGCAFTHVFLGEHVVSIGSKAFANCENLAYVYIPDSTLTIADDAFNDSPGVVIGCHAGSFAQQFALTNRIRYKTVK